MACIIQQDILRLQISVNNLKPMQTLQRAQQFSGIESGAIDIKALFLLQVVEQFAAIDECEDQVKLFGGLEGEFEWDDERVVDL